MAVTKCPECGGKVSDQATSCPHCGVELGQCPECGGLVKLSSTKCPHCGVDLYISNDIEEDEQTSNIYDEELEEGVPSWGSVVIALAFPIIFFAICMITDNWIIMLVALIIYTMGVYMAVFRVNSDYRRIMSVKLARYIMYLSAVLVLAIWGSIVIGENKRIKLSYFADIVNTGTVKSVIDSPSESGGVETSISSDADTSNDLGGAVFTFYGYQGNKYTVKFDEDGTAGSIEGYFGSYTGEDSKYESVRFSYQYESLSLSTRDMRLYIKSQSGESLMISCLELSDGYLYCGTTAKDSKDKSQAFKITRVK